jgi:hypothetical protein
VRFVRDSECNSTVLNTIFFGRIIDLFATFDFNYRFPIIGDPVEARPQPWGIDIFFF